MKEIKFLLLVMLLVILIFALFFAVIGGIYFLVCTIFNIQFSYGVAFGITCLFLLISTLLPKKGGK